MFKQKRTQKRTTQHKKITKAHPQKKIKKQRFSSSANPSTTINNNPDKLHTTTDLNNPTIAKHIPAPLKVNPTHTTFKGQDLNSAESAKKIINLEQDDGYNFMNNADLYDQLQQDKHAKHRMQRKLKQVGDENDLMSGGAVDGEGFEHDTYIQNFEQLRQNIIQTPNLIYANLIKVLLPPNTTLDEYSYLRIKKIAENNPDLLEMNENKLKDRLNQLSQIVLHPAFYNTYQQRHVYKKHNIPQQPPEHSVITESLTQYLTEKKEKLKQGINDNDENYEKQHRAFKKLHQYPYHPMVLHVFEKYPLILRRKNILSTPDLIREVFSTVDYDSEGASDIEQDIENGTLYDENFQNMTRGDDDNGLKNINPYELLGKYPTLLTLDLTNKIHEKIDQLTSHILNFLGNTSNPHQAIKHQQGEDIVGDAADQRWTRQQITKCHQIALQIILEQPDILHANISALIPKRLQFIHQSALFSTGEETINNVILQFPRLLSPGLRASHLQRLALLRLKPPRFDHIAPSDLKGLGYEADFARDMIRRLENTTPIEFPKWTQIYTQIHNQNQHNNNNALFKAKHLTIDEHNEMEKIYEQYDQCWAQLLGKPEDKVELIKILTLMHQKTFHLLFHDFSTARKVANQVKHAVRMGKKFNPEAPSAILESEKSNPTFSNNNKQQQPEKKFTTYDRMQSLAATDLADRVTGKPAGGASGPAGDYEVEGDIIEAELNFDHSRLDESFSADTIPRQHYPHGGSAAYSRGDIPFSMDPNEMDANWKLRKDESVGIPIDSPKDRLSIHSTPSREVVPRVTTSRGAANKTDVVQAGDVKLDLEDKQKFLHADMKITQRDAAREREARYKGKSHGGVLGTAGGSEDSDELDGLDGVVLNDPERIEFGQKLTRAQHKTIIAKLQDGADHADLAAAEEAAHQEHLLKYAHAKKLQKLEKQKLQKMALQEEQDIQQEIDFYEKTNPFNYVAGVGDDLIAAAGVENGAKFVTKLPIDNTSSASTSNSTSGNDDDLKFYADIDVDDLFKDDQQQQTTPVNEAAAHIQAKAAMTGAEIAQRDAQIKMDVLKDKKIKKLQKMYKQQSSEYENKWRGDAKFDRPNM